MSDYYQTLGIDRSASQDDIKRAYRKLASQYHPDKGGDKEKFQEIQAAYSVLSDEQKRAEYDNPRPQFNGFHQNGMPHGFEDIMSQMFGNAGFGDFFGRRPAQPRNRTLNLQTQITLQEAFLGKDLIANLRLPSGREQLLEVKIPAGVRDGTVLRLSGIGDDTVSNAPRGDIHLAVQIIPDASFNRNGDDLIKTLDLDCLEAVIGCKKNIETIDGKLLELNIPAGTQHSQTFSVHGFGMPSMNDNRMRGRLLVTINLIVPRNLSEDKKNLIKQILS